ncbi:MAG: hypothetical protein OXH09_02645 [Gammaproteobacteria bacterium]|nr:hypothetical protein [Gammaproteobacteria bacterium]
MRGGRVVKAQSGDQREHEEDVAVLAAQAVDLRVDGLELASRTALSRSAFVASPSMSSWFRARDIASACPASTPAFLSRLAYLRVSITVAFMYFVRHRVGYHHA